MTSLDQARRGLASDQKGGVVAVIDLALVALRQAVADPKHTAGDLAWQFVRHSLALLVARDITRHRDTLVASFEKFAARKDRAASRSDPSETPVRSGAKSPGTISLPSAIPWKGSARAAWAPSSMALSLGGTSKGSDRRRGVSISQVEVRCLSCHSWLPHAIGGHVPGGHLQQSKLFRMGLACRLIAVVA